MTDRRKLVAFDPDHFAKARATDGPSDPVTAFRYAYEHNLWRGDDTPSGPGSGSDQTSVIARAIPELCRRYAITSLLDIPCGTGDWMARLELPGVQYTGGDIVPEVVAEAARRYGRDDRQFLVLDITRSHLPAADLLLCRDCLVHLSYADIANALANIRRSEITYLLTTTFTAEPDFQDVVTGDWRPINLEAAPFSFPTPVELLLEGCTEQGGAFADKALGLWRVRDLPPVSTDPAAPGPR